jgi:hypothetical protein
MFPLKFFIWFFKYKELNKIKSELNSLQTDYKMMNKSLNQTINEKNNIINNLQQSLTSKFDSAILLYYEIKKLVVMFSNQNNYFFI